MDSQIDSTQSKEPQQKGSLSQAEIEQKVAQRYQQLQTEAQLLV